MTQLCKNCSEEELGADSKDFAEIADEGCVEPVWCDGCGIIYVDSDGRRVSYVQA